MDKPLLSCRTGSNWFVNLHFKNAEAMNDEKEKLKQM